MIHTWVISAVAAVLSVATYASITGTPEPVPVVEPAVSDATRLSRAIVTVGFCSVTCSLIWGISIVKASRSRKERRDGCHG